MKIATINNNNDATYRWGLQGCIGKWHLTTKAAAACWENEKKGVVSKLFQKRTKQLRYRAAWRSLMQRAVSENVSSL